MRLFMMSILPDISSFGCLRIISYQRESTLIAIRYIYIYIHMNLCVCVCVISNLAFSCNYTKASQQKSQIYSIFEHCNNDAGPRVFLGGYNYLLHDNFYSDVRTSRIKYSKVCFPELRRIFYMKKQETGNSKLQHRALLIWTHQIICCYLE